MTTTSIKKEIHKAVDSIDDGTFLKAVYTILWKKIKADPFELTPTHKAMLDSREQKHSNGESKSYTWNETKKIIRTRNKSK